MASDKRKWVNREIKKYAGSVVGKVLVAGAGADLDKEGKPYRSYFSKARVYDKLDLPGCKSQPPPKYFCSISKMTPVPSNSYDCVFANQVFEHTLKIQEAVMECFRVLSPKGILIGSVPYKLGIHGPPNFGDFWRPTEYGWRYLLRGFKLKYFSHYGDKQFPELYFFVCRKKNVKWIDSSPKEVWGKF